MKNSCEIIRDLLPLYIDDVASKDSCRLVEEHLEECADCRIMLKKLKNNEAENIIVSEKEGVITEQRKRFKRKSALAGSIIAGILMIPILVCLIVNIASGSGMGWFFIVLSSLLTTASLTVLPLMMPENKGLWTLGGFTASLLLLLGVCCLYSRGDWFFVAGTSVLFGFTLIFLPFVLKSKALSGYFKNRRGLTAMATDTVMYLVMMLAIGLRSGSPDFFRIAAIISVPFILLAWALFVIIRYGGKSKCVKAGSCIALCGAFTFFINTLVNTPLGIATKLPEFKPLIWNISTIDGNTKWLILLGCVAAGVILCLIGIMKGRKTK